MEQGPHQPEDVVEQIQKIGVEARRPDCNEQCDGSDDEETSTGIRAYAHFTLLMMRLTLSLRAATWSAITQNNEIDRMRLVNRGSRDEPSPRTLVGSQVAVDETERRVVEIEADDDTALVA
jgi:hypothetical protein